MKSPEVSTRSARTICLEEHPNAVGPHIPARALPLLLIAFFASFSLLPMVWSSRPLSHSFWAATGMLLLLFVGLKQRAWRTGRVLSYEWAPRKVHYVQLLMHSCIYAYWGWYWREVYRYAPLIVAQIVFCYALDMMLCWWRRDKWVAGFGPFPIVLSTNLFLWFREDWFFMQFLLVGSALASKELLRWKRNGRMTHIFNPSAFGLFVFSVGLIIAHATQLSRGGDIAFTLSYPPHIYLEIFIVGLVVQTLFSVTLVTLSAVAGLCILNLTYTQLTGSHQFTDSNIPVLVFLGAHLLVTDPATSPRTTFGRIVFGGLYGISVFALRGMLGWFGIPLFYDKLLCVPALNLSVQRLDRIGAAVGERFRHLKPGWTWSPAQANLGHMAVWVMVFTSMMVSGFLGYTDMEANPGLWRLGCLHGRGSDCIAWLRELHSDCDNASARACFTLGRVLTDGRAVPGDSLTAAASLERSCKLGYAAACTTGRGASHETPQQTSGPYSVRSRPLP
jgi:hypothetical protein